jgi:hypothetical protein
MLGIGIDEFREMLVLLYEEEGHEKSDFDFAYYVDRVCFGGKNSNVNCTST